MILRYIDTYFTASVGNGEKGGIAVCLGSVEKDRNYYREES